MESEHTTVSQIGVPKENGDIMWQNEIKKEEMIHFLSRNGSFGENTTSLSGAFSYKWKKTSTSINFNNDQVTTECHLWSFNKHLIWKYTSQWKGYKEVAKEEECHCTVDQQNYRS